MDRWAAGFCAVLLAGAAVDHAAAGAILPKALPPPTVYTCPDGQTVSARYPDATTATIDYRDATHVLKAAVSADGVRYVGDGLQWWTKGMTMGMISGLAPGAEYAEPGPECDAPAADGPSG